VSILGNRYVGGSDGVAADERSIDMERVAVREIAALAL
jgi:hypothetical protein